MIVKNYLMNLLIRRLLYYFKYYALSLTCTVYVCQLFLNDHNFPYLPGKGQQIKQKINAVFLPVPDAKIYIKAADRKRLQIIPLHYFQRLIILLKTKPAACAEGFIYKIFL